MAKYYVESGTMSLITEAEDHRGAALWAIHRCMEQVLPVCPGDPQTPEQKNQKLRERGCDVLDEQICVSERGFAREDATRFETAEMFVEWNQLMMAMAQLERRMQIVG